MRPRSVRRKPPRLIHNLWIRLKKRSKVIERTCLVGRDRPYSPSLDGGLQRRQSTAGRKASRSHSDGRRRKLQTPDEQGRRLSFQSEYRKKRKSKGSEKISGHQRQPELDTATPLPGAPAPLGP